MTAQELGLPPRFEEAMKKRLGATGIFVDVGGKYYLDEAKLKQVQEERRAGGLGGGGMGGGQRQLGSVFALRIARMVVGLTAVILALSNILFAERVSQSCRARSGRAVDGPDRVPVVQPLEGAEQVAGVGCR
jgi:hypothetical protein